MKQQLRIESIVHGGDALARSEGRVVFVPGGAPGDLVEVELADDPSSDRFLRGKLLQVLEAGPSRAVAPCPIVDRCGGCPLQHVSSEAQREAKRALVADALARTGGFAEGSYALERIVASPAELRYRRRARLHRGPQGAWGFAERGSRRVTPVDECLLFEPALQAFADEVRAAAGALPDAVSLGFDVTSQGARSLDIRTEKPAGAALRKRALALLERVPKLRGLTLGPQGAAELIGEPAIADAAGPAGLSRARFRTRADLFAQANRAATPLLIQAALDALGDAIAGRVVELYCGAGTFTLPLLERAAQVTAVEFAAASLDLLRKSAAEASLDAGGKLRLVAADAAKAALPQADAVLLDPPRTGAAAAMEKVTALGASRIAYVSCDAPTLARDAKALAARGYRLERVVPLDLFPQTAHLEAVASFVAR